MKFIKTIQNFAFQNELWQKNAKLIVGVSGGPDSVCLLDVLSVLAKKYDFCLHIAHVNYGLRAGDSDKDEQLVRQLAKKYAVEITVLHPDRSWYKGNLESQLRNIRYAFFEQLRKELKFDLIAVAHNSDDQAETVLMRIIRGSGLNGLAAMKAKNGHIIRPLLKTSRQEILAYVKDRKLKFRIDKSNKDLKFTRNVIRHKLLPSLAKQFNPRIKQTLNEWSLNVADEYDFIAQEAERFANTICKIKYAHFSQISFLEKHVAIQRQALRQLHHEITGVADLESKQLEEILKVIRSAKNKTQKAKIAGLKIVKKGDIIDIFG